MTMKELATLPLEQQREWVDGHRQECAEMIRNACADSYRDKQAVLFPHCCRYCIGCALQGLAA